MWKMSNERNGIDYRGKKDSNEAVIVGEGRKIGGNYAFAETAQNCGN